MAIVDGDLFENTHRYELLVQECDCVSLVARGLAADIANTFGSYADVYGKRDPAPDHRTIACKEDRATPGTMSVCLTSGPEKPNVACVFGKWGTTLVNPPGEARPETHMLRERWFFSALEQLIDYISATIFEPITIAFPYHIGCGRHSGGNWEKYAAVIAGFADTVKRRGGHNVVIYRKRL